jgi:mono/diheme cytochrome c family protein
MNRERTVMNRERTVTNLMRGALAALLGSGFISGSILHAQSAPSAGYAEVAPIVAVRCAGCHRTGGGAPMALGSWQALRAWAVPIARAVRDRAMPPWRADPCCGSFANDRSLSESERQLLLDWLAAGLPGGPSESTPEPATSHSSVDDGWAIGPPDVIIELPLVEIPADGNLPYHDLVVDAPFEHEVWVQAAQTRPGNSDVVHHIIVDVVAPSRSRRPGEDPRTAGSLGGYVPGDGPLVMPPGLARRIPAGAKLYFQIHYTPSGRVETDRSRLGLVLSEGVPEHEALTGIVSDPFLWIPAGKVTRKEARTRFERDALLLSLRPHLHLRGRSFTFLAHLPNGTEETLLHVPSWDFAWQTTYVLAEPRLLPAGSELVAVATWDNTANHPNNPDATRDVSWGEATEDEMMIGFYDYYEP